MQDESISNMHVFVKNCLSRIFNEIYTVVYEIPRKHAKINRNKKQK